MLPGVYWHYGFPESLYHFDFFTFRPGLGGHADEPAKLTATVQAPDPAALLAQVRAVAAGYSDGYLFAQAHGSLLHLDLTVEHYGGSAQRWPRFVTCRYDAASRTWLLHRDGGERFYATDPAHGTTSMRTTTNFGRVPLTQFDSYLHQE